MMQYLYGSSMWGGAGLFAFLTWFVVLVDLVLLGLWLWKQISKK